MRRCGRLWPDNDDTGCGGRACRRILRNMMDKNRSGCSCRFFHLVRLHEISPRGEFFCEGSAVRRAWELGIWNQQRADHRSGGGLPAQRSSCSSRASANSRQSGTRWMRSYRRSAASMARSGFLARRISIDCCRHLKQWPSELIRVLKKLTRYRLMASRPRNSNGAQCDLCRLSSAARICSIKVLSSNGFSTIETSILLASSTVAVLGWVVIRIAGTSTRRWRSFARVSRPVIPGRW
jgi:hypothetical protein